MYEFVDGNKIIVHGRNTGHGAFTDAAVYSPEGKEIPPFRESRSRTGRHWTKEWKLPTGGFIFIYYDRTNSGHTQLEVLELQDGGSPVRHVWYDQAWYEELEFEEIFLLYKTNLHLVDE